MVFQGSKLKVADNSGARIVKCIKVLNKNRNYGCSSDLILLTLNKFKRNKKKIKKRVIYLGIIVSTKF